MKREIALQKNEMMSGNAKRRLTTRNIALVLLNIFPNHIGRANGISKQTLFKKVYGKKHDDNSLSDFMRWEFMKRALHMLRQQSNCFVISEKQGDEWFFFVVKDEQDVEIYTNRIDDCIKRMRSMQKRCATASQGQWYQQSFALPERKSILQLGLKK